MKKTTKKTTTKPVVKKVETKKVKENKVKKTWNTIVKAISENLVLSVLILICILLIVNMVLITIGNRTKLSEGEEIVAEYDGNTITAEDLYESLKETSGLNSVVNELDEYILNDGEYDLETIEQEVQDYIDSTRSAYEENGSDFDAALVNAGYEDEEAFKEMLITNEKQTAVVLSYVKENLTDEEILEYYEENIFDNYTVKNIIITPDVDSEMTDEEISSAEDAAEAKAKEAISKLNDGEDWASVFDEYNTDSSVDEGLLENFTYGDVDDTFFTAVEELEDDEYTSEPVIDSMGYNIILRVSSSEKASLEDKEEEIKESLANTKLSEDEDLFSSTFVKLREEYGFTIYDTIIKNAYDSIIEED